MKSVRLPPPPGCGGCSRRELLHRLGVAAVGALVVAAGCSEPGASMPTAPTSVCGTGAAIDLGDAANRPLAGVGGAMLIDMAGDTVMVVRVSDTQAVAVSAI